MSMQEMCILYSKDTERKKRREARGNHATKRILSFGIFFFFSFSLSFSLYLLCIFCFALWKLHAERQFSSYNVSKNTTRAAVFCVNEVKRSGRKKIRESVQKEFKYFFGLLRLILRFMKIFFKKFEVVGCSRLC